jgi:hypothetical protein
MSEAGFDPEIMEVPLATVTPAGMIWLPRAFSA